VGDLIACVMPELDTSAQEGCYVLGTPVVEVGTKDEATDNRMELQPVSWPVRMQSFDLGVCFRQSNQSEKFIAGQSDEAQPSEEEATQSRYLETGRLLHRVLQNIRLESDIDSILDQFEREGLISRTTASGTEVAIPRSSVERWVRQGLRAPLVNDWFQPHWQLFNECSILSIEDGQVCQHRPDRVMTDGHQWIVVDFKFGSPKPEYHDQVRRYMQLLSDMTASDKSLTSHLSPLTSIKGYLWYVYSNLIEEVK
jgi:hypothetical protein